MVSLLEEVRPLACLQKVTLPEDPLEPLIFLLLVFKLRFFALNVEILDLLQGRVTEPVPHLLLLLLRAGVKRPVTNNVDRRILWDVFHVEKYFKFLRKVTHFIEQLVVIDKLSIKHLRSHFDRVENFQVITAEISILTRNHARSTDYNVCKCKVVEGLELARPYSEHYHSDRSRVHCSHRPLHYPNETILRRNHLIVVKWVAIASTYDQQQR